MGILNHKAWCIGNLPLQVGADEDHCPLVVQVRLTVPPSSYPFTQVYVAIRLYVVPCRVLT